MQPLYIYIHDGDAVPRVQSRRRHRSFAGHATAILYMSADATTRVHAQGRPWALVLALALTRRRQIPAGAGARVLDSDDVDRSSGRAFVCVAGSRLQFWRRHLPGALLACDRRLALPSESRFVVYAPICRV